MRDLRLSHRGWHQFSLRNLFAVVTVLAVGSGWYAFVLRQTTEHNVLQWLAKVPHSKIWGIIKWESPDERQRALSFNLEAWVAEGRKIQGGEPILQAILERRDSRVDLSRVAFALGKLGDRRCVPVLIDCLNSPDQSLQVQAINALGELGDPRAVEPLGTRLMLLIERDENVLIGMLGALDQIGGEPAKEYLNKAADGGDVFLAEAAKELLVTENPESQLAPADSLESVAREVGVDRKTDRN